MIDIMLSNEFGAWPLGHSQAQKQVNHARIVAIAARRLRERGLDGVSVAEIMAEAGLTHGGFYAHFSSRDDLVREALAFALSESERRSKKAAAKLGGDPFQAWAESYLSAAHRDDVARGCALAALGPEVARAPRETRALLTQDLQRRLGARGRKSEAAALAALSTAVGALILARAVDDETLSDAILTAARAALAK
jgi:TetR/AcrR family transcriptional repressor of nem operon